MPYSRPQASFCVMSLLDTCYGAGDGSLVRSPFRFSVRSCHWSLHRHERVSEDLLMCIPRLDQFVRVT